MNKLAQSMTMTLVVVVVIIIVFLAVSALWSGKLPGLFNTVTSPFDDVCCCDKTITDCEIKTKQECKQTVQPMETCTQRGIK